MSARESFYTYGIGSPATFLHFCHALGERANVKVDLSRGVIPFVTKASFVACESAFREQVFDIPRPANRNKLTGIARTDIIRGHMSGGVIFYVNGNEQEDLFKIEKTLKGLRFGGGTLLAEQNGIKALDKPEQLLFGLAGFTPKKSFVFSIEKIKKDLEFKEGSPKTDYDFMDRFIYSITPHKSKGWKCPFLAGYRFLETPVKRMEARHITARDLHVFAEPVLGVLQWVSCSISKGESASRWYINHNESGIRYSNEPNGE